MNRYRVILTAEINRKGVLDLDTVKGCTLGMKAHPNGGCYGVCYACKMSKFYGYDFTRSVVRVVTQKQLGQIARTLHRHWASWFRVGTMGDPCHDWRVTIAVCQYFSTEKTPIIITKHWIPLADHQIEKIARMRAIVNTSISALDTDEEREHRLEQYRRLAAAGVRSVLRVVSCKFGDTSFGQVCSAIQDELFKEKNVIDNPLRLSLNDHRVKSGDIIVERHKDLGGGSIVSIAHASAYLGKCIDCPDQCGATMYGRKL